MNENFIEHSPPIHGSFGQPNFYYSNDFYTFRFTKGVKKLIEKIASESSVTLVELTEEKYWFRKHYTYVVRGSRNDIGKFKRLSILIEKY